MTKFSLYNPVYGPIGSKCSVNKILHGPFMLKLFQALMRSKVVCYFVHCEFSGSVFNIDIGRVRAKL